MPTPATIRVVQIEPGPMPTFTASAPAPISARVASAVATLPATTWVAFDSAFTRSTAAATPAEWPCAVSITIRSAPASTSAALRSKPASPTVVAAATLSRPSASLQACGLSTARSISRSVRRPVSLPALFTTRKLFDPARPASAPALRRGSPALAASPGPWAVIIADTGVASCSAKRMSRFVTMPTGWPLPSTTGKPVIR